MLPLLAPTPCPVCSADPLAAHVLRNRDSILPAPFYALFVCPACGLLYVGPRPDAESVARFYAAGGHGGDEWHAGKSTPEETARWRETKAAGAAAKAAALRAFMAPGDVLDYGCGVGALLDALQRDGWRTSGLEPHPIGAVAAERHRMLQTLPDEPTFDLVIAHHVLEHLIDPADALRRLRGCTRPGGALYVSVPSVDALPDHGDLHYVCNPIHMNGFTAEALTNALRMTGWAVEHTARRGAKKLEAVARRADPAAPIPVVPTALSALRAYARRLNAEGRFSGHRASTEPSREN